MGGLAGGAAGGYVGGFTGGLVETGDFSMAHKAGIKSMGMGAGIGAVMGGTTSYSIAKSQGINPWSGVAEKSVVIGRNQYGRVDIAAKDLKSGTISADWESYFDNLKPTLKQGLDFNYEWFDSKLNNGFKVFDIGRGNYLDYSPNYMMELNTLMHRGIPTIQTNYNSYYQNKLRILLWNNQ